MPNPNSEQGSLDVRSISQQGVHPNSAGPNMLNPNSEQDSSDVRSNNRQGVRTNTTRTNMLKTNSEQGSSDVRFCGRPSDAYGAHFNETTNNQEDAMEVSEVYYPARVDGREKTS